MPVLIGIFGILVVVNTGSEPGGFPTNLPGGPQGHNPKNAPAMRQLMRLTLLK
jgi:hypothetical protein